jgi:hypoxanthine phosphoribosyltransferase
MFLNLSAWQINLMVWHLAATIRPHKAKYQYVVGIANGGLHISKPLAEQLKLPHAQIRISHYNGHMPRKIPIIEGQLPKGPCLIVDDLIDGGFTMQTCEKHFGKHDTAVLFWNKDSYKPTYYVQEKPPLWVTFPWSD